MHQRAERRPYCLEEVSDLAAMRGWGVLDEKLAKLGERVAMVGVDDQNLARSEHPQHTPKDPGIRGGRGRDFVAGALSFVEKFGNAEFRGDMYRLAGGASPDQFPETSFVAEFLVGIGHGYDFRDVRCLDSPS